MSSCVQDFLKIHKYTGHFFENKDLSRYSWFQVGGKAEYFFIPHSIQDLSIILQAKGHRNIFVLGAGSNTLIRQGGIKGFVIWMGKINHIEVEAKTPETTWVRVGAGVLNKKFVSWTQENGLGGAEFTAGIPGTLGGGVFMNAECHQHAFADIVHSIRGFTHSGEPFSWTQDQIQWTYRKTIFPQPCLITEVILQLTPKDPQDILEHVQRLLQIRKNTQPVGEMSCGSIFKNPSLELKAWTLIDQCGLRGFSINGAQISTMHSNFLINTGGATAQDLERIGDHVQKCVLEKTGICLEWEIQRVGEDHERNPS